MSSAREELGYTPEALSRTGPKIFKSFLDPFKKVIVKPSKEVVKERVMALGAEILSDLGQEIVLKIQNRKIELWCETDCYYLESKGEYGSGILHLLTKIENHLKSQGLASLG